MADVYGVRSDGETLQTIARAQNTTVEKLCELNPRLSKDSKLKIGDRIKLDWIRYQLKGPRVIAIAQDKYLKPRIPFPDAANLPGVAAPRYGQDITSGLGRAAPNGQGVGKTPAELKPKMLKLLNIFAHGDKTGMALRLFSRFLSKQSTVLYFEDSSLNQAAAAHQNVIDFCDMAMSAPNSRLKSVGKTRIHQALRNASWDINKLMTPTDLGVPAFNSGNKAFSSGDFDNGLGLMINGVQYAYAVATAYDYDESKQRYKIKIKFVFYDVFGLDDDDLDEFGASSDSVFSSNSSVGITAWWQLQHQHGYAPLVTRAIVERNYEVPTK